MQDNLQLSFVCNGRRVSSVPLNYSMTGHASAAWLTVAEAYPCTEYSGSGTETVHQPTLTKTQTPDNCKLSIFLHF